MSHYFKKTAVLATAFVAALSMQSTAVRAFEIADYSTLITKITAADLNQMVKDTGTALNDDGADTGKNNTAQMWSDAGSIGLLKDLIMAKVVGCFMLQYAQDYFADLANIDKADDIEVLLRTAIHNKLTTLGATQTPGATAAEKETSYTFNDHNFTLEQLGIDALVKKVATVITNARQILKTAKAGAGKLGASFFEFSVGTQTVKQYIETVIDKIAQAINDEITTLATQLTRVATVITGATAGRNDVPKGLRLGGIAKAALTQMIAATDATDAFKGIPTEVNDFV